MTNPRSDTLVIIPAYNEGGKIAGIIAKIKSLGIGLDVAVVDDGSKDDTVSKAKDAGAVVLPLPGNLGYGGALQTGFRYALQNGYSYAVQIDADGQHEPTYIKDLLSPVKAGMADVSLGSRFMGLGDYKPTFARAMGIKLFGGIASAIIGRKVTDPTTGFQALNRDVIRFYASDTYPVDFPDADVLIMLHRAGLRSIEVPVMMYPRTEGTSMHSGLKPLYYIFKMMLSILVTLMRKNAFRKG
ncbi:MAG TPA: glycosyltransferase family 2 protein [Nitrospirota bacterium]